MGEIERHGNAAHVCRTEPFARYPCKWPQPDAVLFELFIESTDTILEPGAFDRNPQMEMSEKCQIQTFKPKSRYFGGGGIAEEWWSTISQCSPFLT